MINHKSLCYWENIFCNAEIYQKRNSLSQKEFDNTLEMWNSKLLIEEKEILNKYMTLNDIEKASNYFQDKILPKSYLNFLLFCNIAEMQNGERYFQFLSLRETREYTIAYMFPKWLSGGITFAINGGGVHYVFDMRYGHKKGEYPIYAISSSNIGWGKMEAFFLGNSFLDVITEKTNIEHLMN